MVSMPTGPPPKLTAIKDIIEPYMIQQGFIQRTPSGSVLTAIEWKHLGMQPHKDMEAAQFRLFQEDN
ncbi:Holliday junction DNA helicase RuvB C-terminal domain-containing protein, partial [Rhizobium ruizarguesonis]